MSIRGTYPRRKLAVNILKTQGSRFCIRTDDSALKDFYAMEKYGWVKEFDYTPGGLVHFVFTEAGLTAFIRA